jgi:uncharacterized protein
MADLPLFPLNTVLFPGMQLQLHIFEERYKSMINDCITEEKPFGVVLIQSGQESSAPIAKPHDVGCMAQITQVERLPFGRMNIVAIGQQRFRINFIIKQHPYLLADVEAFSPTIDDEDLITQYGQQLRPLIIRYLEILSEVGEIKFDPSHIPDNAHSLAHVAAVLLQSENPQKQDLLATDKTSSLLRKLLEIYRLETKLLEVRTSPPDESFDIGPFSSN